MGQRGRPRLNPSTSGRSPADEVIDAAIQLIDDRGLHALTVSALADELNVARTVVYHHFGDVDGVIAAVGTRIVGPLFDELDRLDATDETAAQKLRAYFTAETTLLATTPVPVEVILNNPRLAEPSHSRLWDSLTELQTRLTSWLVSATGANPADASTRLLGASAMTLGMRVLAPQIRQADLHHLIELQLELLGLEPHAE